MKELTDLGLRPTAEVASRIAQRAAGIVAQRAEELHRDAVARWAMEDEGPLPTRGSAWIDAEEELEILCRALGQWAALEPQDVFPPRPRSWWRDIDESDGGW